MNYLLLLILLGLGLSHAYSPSLLYPHTLISTDVPCLTMQDCRLHYNQSWCESADVMCIHRYCKLIPGHPCRATQQCLEAEKRCITKKCVTHEDCDNGIYCDGAEICQGGLCLIDPTQPNCIYTGGECDEAEKKCYEPRVRLAWRGHSGGGVGQHISLFSTVVTALSAAPTTTNTSVISQTAVNLTGLIIIAVAVGFLFFLIIIFIVSRSIRAGYTKSRYVS